MKSYKQVNCRAFLCRWHVWPRKVAVGRSSDAYWRQCAQHPFKISFLNTLGFISFLIKLIYYLEGRCLDTGKRLSNFLFDENVPYLAVLCPCPRTKPMAAEEREKELAGTQLETRALTWSIYMCFKKCIPHQQQNLKYALF